MSLRQLRDAQPYKCSLLSEKVEPTDRSLMTQVCTPINWCCMTHPLQHAPSLHILSPIRKHNLKFVFFLVSLIFRKPLFNRMDVWTVFWCVGITGDIMLFIQIHCCSNTVWLFMLSNQGFLITFILFPTDLAKVTSYLSIIIILLFGVVLCYICD